MDETIIMMSLLVIAAPLFVASCCLGWDIPEGSREQKVAGVLAVASLGCLFVGGGWAGFFDELGLSDGFRLTDAQLVLTAVLATGAALVVVGVFKCLRLGVFDRPYYYYCDYDTDTDADADEAEWLPEARDLHVKLLSYEEIKRATRHRRS